MKIRCSSFIYTTKAAKEEKQNVNLVTWYPSLARKTVLEISIEMLNANQNTNVLSKKLLLLKPRVISWWIQSNECWFASHNLAVTTIMKVHEVYYNFYDIILMISTALNHTIPTTVHVRSTIIICIGLIMCNPYFLAPN